MSGAGSSFSLLTLEGHENIGEYAEFEVSQYGFKSWFFFSLLCEFKKTTYTLLASFMTFI